MLLTKYTCLKCEEDFEFAGHEEGDVPDACANLKCRSAFYDVPRKGNLSKVVGQHHCLRCGKYWNKKTYAKSLPRRCPFCNSFYWQTMRDILNLTERNRGGYTK